MVGVTFLQELASKLRAIMSLKRSLDSVPSQAELIQYVLHSFLLINIFRLFLLYAIAFHLFSETHITVNSMKSFSLVLESSAFVMLPGLRYPCLVCVHAKHGDALLLISIRCKLHMPKDQH